MEEMKLNGKLIVKNVYVSPNDTREHGLTKVINEMEESGMTIVSVAPDHLNRQWFFVTARLHTAVKK